MSDESFNDAQPFPPDSVADAAGASLDLKSTRRRGQPANNGRIDRLPPHSPKAEQGTLGCALLSPKDVMPHLVTKFRGNDEVYYDLRHQTIFAHLSQMAMNDIASIDTITLQQRLKDFGLLEEIGGIPYLNALQDGVPSPGNVSYYADIVLEKYLMRKLLQTCIEIAGRIYEYKGEADQLLDESERDILKIRGDMATSEAVPLRDLINPALATIENFFNRTGEVGGIRTGFADFDRMTDGLQPGEVYIIAARPSQGKTALLLNIFDYISGTNNIPTAIFSLEMTKEALALRMLTSRSRTNLRNIREGFMAESDFPKLTSAAGKLRNAPIYIDDSPSLSIMEIRARARAYVQKFGIKAIGLDYMQLARSTTRRAQENRQQEISEISSGVKALAKELRVPVIVLSQLNRQVERDKNRKPKLSDLRESGAIEQDADLVGLLYKASLDGEDNEGYEEPDGIPVNLLIAKQRNGPTGDVNLTFLKPFTKFESAARVSDKDIPTDYQPPLPDA